MAVATFSQSVYASAVERQAGLRGSERATTGGTGSDQGWLPTDGLALGTRTVETRFAGSASNHEEAMGGVAPELFDEAIFPIEIGLHRVRPGIGSLIRTPVAV